MSAPSRRMRLVSSALALGLALCTTGCIEHSLRELIRPTHHPIPVPPENPPATDGAIWRGATQSGSFLYFDRKARGLGDLVTVSIFEDLRAEGSANTSLESSGSYSASLSSDLGFTDLLRSGARVLLGLIGVGDVASSTPGETINAINTTRANGFDGDGETNRESRFTGTVTCQIIRVHPGGIFEIYGRREILINHELQLVTVEGLVRRDDIGIDNQVGSSQLANAKLTFDGIGVLDDKQRPSLIARALDWLYPF